MVPRQRARGPGRASRKEMLSTLEATPHEKCSPTFSRAGSTMTQWDSKAADEDQPSPKLGSPEARASERGSQRLKAAVRDHIEETRRVKRGKRIRVGYKINGIRNVNSIDCTFTIDFKVFYYWTDYRVKGRPKGTVVDIHEPDLFQPELIISNEAELSLTHWEFQVKDPKTGLLKLSEYYRGKLLIPNMSLHFFPFDVQNLRICIKPHKKTIDEVELHPLVDEMAIEHHARHEWRVIGSCTAMYATNPEHSTTGKVYSSLHIIVLVERESDWFIRMIMLPILLIAVCSLCCFAFGVDDIAGRMETAVALLLTNVATKFTIADYMPKVPYRTLCDFYLDVCFFCQFGIAISNAALFLLYRCLPRYSVRVGYGVGGFKVVDVANVACLGVAAYALLKLNVHTFFRLDAHHRDVEEWRKQALPASSPPPEANAAGVKLSANAEATAAGRLRHLFAIGKKSERSVAPHGGGGGQHHHNVSTKSNLSVHTGAENLEPQEHDADTGGLRPKRTGGHGGLLTPNPSLTKVFKSTPKIGDTGFASESFKDYGDYMREQGYGDDGGDDGDDDRGGDDAAAHDGGGGGGGGDAPPADDADAAGHGHDAEGDDLSVSTTAWSVAQPRTRTSGAKSHHVGENNGSGSYAFVASAGKNASRGSVSLSQGRTISTENSTTTLAERPADD